MEKVRILVVEDDQELREAIAEVLDDEGYEVLAADKGEKAVSLASEHLFDLVVTDIKMPGIDGLEALEQVKEKQPEVKSLVVTGYSSHRDAVRAVKLGVGDYLQKPFGLGDLLARIKEMVAERQAELRERQQQEDHLRATVSALSLACRMAQPKLLAASKLAESLGDSNALLCQAVTLATGCRQMMSDTSDYYFGTKIEALMEQALEHWDGTGPDGIKEDEIDYSSRVAALCLFHCLEEDKPLPPGRFDPNLVARLQSPDKAAPPSSSELQSMLTLGQAFERGGDLENAFRAYHNLIKSGVKDQTVFEAALGEARLERVLGGDKLSAKVKSLLDLGASLGTQTKASALLEGGLLLLPDPRAEQLLKQAKDMSAELNDALFQARVSLGLVTLGIDGPVKDSLQCLSLEENSWSFSDAAPWLLPWILEQADSVDHQLPLRLMSEAPLALQALLEADALSLGARLNAVEVLRKAGSELTLTPLRILMQDKEPQIRQALEAILQENRLGLDAPRLALRNFGPFKVARGESLIPESAWKHKKVKYLLAYLARNWRNPVTDEQLMEEFWPGPADRAKRSLYQATYNLRRCLKDPEQPGIDYVRREKGCLSLNTDLPIQNDLQYLEKALAAGCKADNREVLTRGLSLYKGPYLERCYMDWAVSARGSLELKVMEAFRWLTKDCIQREDWKTALTNADKLFAMDSLAEEHQELKMRALVSSGEFSTALEHYKECEKLLRTEMGLEPSIELLRMREETKLRL